jgi:hypothetical protein
MDICEYVIPLLLQHLRPLPFCGANKVYICVKQLWPLFTVLYFIPGFSEHINYLPPQNYDMNDESNITGDNRHQYLTNKICKKIQSTFIPAKLYKN